MSSALYKSLAGALLGATSLLHAAVWQPYGQNNCRSSIRHIEAGGIGYDDAIQH